MKQQQPFLFFQIGVSLAERISHVHSVGDFAKAVGGWAVERWLASDCHDSKGTPHLLRPSDRLASIRETEKIPARSAPQNR